MKSAYFLKGNCKIKWVRLVNKYAPHTALSLLKLKSEFHNSRLESIEKDPDESVLNLEGLRICMSEFGPNSNIPDEYFIIHVLNNLPEEHDLILDGLEKPLMEVGTMH